MTVVVDASVALKWYVSEDESKAALALLESDERLIAPDRPSALLITRTAATVITAGLLKPANAASGWISPSRTQAIRLVIATTS